MTNAEKFKSDAERQRAFDDFCYSHKHCDDCSSWSEDGNCIAAWLDLEAPSETVDEILNKMQQAGKILGGETGGIIRMYADRIDKALDCSAAYKKSFQVVNAMKVSQALKEIQAIIKVYNKGLVSTQTTTGTIEEIIEQALSEPPRNCDVMSLEMARKVWFAKEIIPRLDGDLPLGKEVPFEDWFVSQQEGK